MRFLPFATVVVLAAAPAWAEDRMQLVTTDGKAYEGTVVTDSGRGVVFQTRDNKRRFVAREKISSLLPWAERKIDAIPEEIPPPPPDVPRKVVTTDGKGLVCSSIEVIETGLLLKTTDGRTVVVEFSRVAKVLDGAAALAPEIPSIDARCPAGKEIGADTNGNCCWPGQVWSKSVNACRGIPTCVPGLKVSGENCVLEAHGR